MNDLIQQLEQLSCGGGLYIHHNDHRADNITPGQWFIDHDHGNSKTQFADISEEEKAECIRLDSIWYLQWYPNTPTSFYCVAASTFEKCLQAAMEVIL